MMTIMVHGSADNGMGSEELSAQVQYNPLREFLIIVHREHTLSQCLESSVKGAGDCKIKH